MIDGRLAGLSFRQIAFISAILEVAIVSAVAFFSLEAKKNQKLWVEVLFL